MLTSIHQLSLMMVSVAFWGTLLADGGGGGVSQMRSLCFPGCRGLSSDFLTHCCLNYGACHNPGHGWEWSGGVGHAVSRSCYSACPARNISEIQATHGG